MSIDSWGARIVGTSVIVARVVSARVWRSRSVVACLAACLLAHGCRSGRSQAPGDAGADVSSADTSGDVAATGADAATPDRDGATTGADVAVPRDGPGSDADAATPDTRQDAGGGDASPTRPLVWRSLTLPGIESEWVYAIWGTGPTELYVGTSLNKILHRNSAGTWSTQTLPGSGGVNWIWGSGPTDVYATIDTAGGGLYHSTGNDIWTPVTLPNEYFGFPAQVLTTKGIWGLSANEVFVAGSITYTLATQSPTAGAIFRLKDGAWTISGTMSPMYQVWASSSTDIYGMGGIGQSLYHSSGDDTWRNQSVASGNGMGALWGSDASNVFVVTTTYNRNMGPTLVFRSGGTGSWTLDFSIETSEMRTLWGNGPNDVYLGGTFLAPSSFDNVGVLYHRASDGQWTPVTLPRLSHVKCVWGNSATNVYVGGRLFDLPLNGALLQGTAN